MTDKTRIKIAAIVTLLFLVGVSAVGLAARTDKPPTAVSAVAPAAQQTSATARSAAAEPSTYEDDREDGERSDEEPEHDE